MATTASAALRKAASQIGYIEGGGSDGRSGNITKFWAALKPSFQGSPWCAAFAPSWTLWSLNSLDLLDDTLYFYCPYIEQFAKKKGQWSTTPKVGSYVLYSFGEALAVHVGIVEKVLDGGLIQTIEGNTSPSNAGSQNNGGGVYRRVRSASYGVRGYFHPNYANEPQASPVPSPYTPAPAPKPAPAPTATYPSVEASTLKLLQKWAGLTGTDVDGAWGPTTAKAVQRKVGVTADGIIGAGTTRAVQKAFGTPQDGVWGAATTAAIRAKLAPVNTVTQKHDLVEVDGDLGPATIRAMQTALGVKADGKWGVNSKKALQKRVKVAQDGVVGINTIKALQRYLKIPADGKWGPNTTRAIQSRLNARTF